MGTWKRFWNLAGRDRIVALEAAAVIVATRVGLRVGYRRWVSVLAAFFPPDVISNENLFFFDTAEARAEVNRIARVSSGAARRLFFRPTCLERSIGLWWVLRRRGIEAEIHIGGRKSGVRFEAHAWVKCAGTVLSDANDEYREFIAFDDANVVAARQLR
jgi:hypothetical protein